MDSWKLFLRKTKTLIGLSRKEQLLLFQGLILLPLISISLKVWGYQQTQNWLNFLAPLKQKKQADFTINSVVQTARMVRVAARYNRPWAKCLQQSLVLWALLKYQGITSQIRLGVNRDQGQFQAHAWVEYKGFALNEQEEIHQQFSVLKNLIEAKR